MLLDIGSVLIGIGLAVVAFLVVILVCVVILRLLAAILPSYEERDAARLAATIELSSEDEGAAAIEAEVLETPGVGDGGAQVPGTDEGDTGGADADAGPGN
jgi:hypothetical protein